MLPRADETITVWPRRSATLRSGEPGCTTMPSDSALPTRVATILSGVLPTAAAFASKQIDAWAIFDPYYTIALQQGGRILRDGRGINTALGFITASEAALADVGKRAAIVQFLDRLARAGDWALANPEAYAQAYTQLTRLPIEAARTITARSAVAGRPVSEADIVALQTVADRSARDGILPVRVDVRAITDAQLWRRAA